MENKGAVNEQTVLCSPELSNKNLELKKELWERGFYVNEVGHDNECHYLIVSCMTPKDTVPIDHTAN